MRGGGAGAAMRGGAAGAAIRGGCGAAYAAAVPGSNGAVNETVLETSDGSNFTGSNGG